MAGLIATMVTGPYSAVLPAMPLMDETTVKELLRLTAAGMLTIITVTLSVLMLVLSILAGQASPRAVPELMTDPITQNALSSFLATFVFAVSSLFLIGFGALKSAGYTALFTVAAVLLFLSIKYLVQWMHHIASTLKLSGTISQVHDRAEECLRKFLSGGALSPDGAGMVPSGRLEDVRPEKAGYVQLIDVDMLDAIAREHDITAQLTVPRG